MTLGPEYDFVAALCWDGVSKTKGTVEARRALAVIRWAQLVEEVGLSSAEALVRNGKYVGCLHPDERELLSEFISRS